MCPYYCCMCMTLCCYNALYNYPMKNIAKGDPPFPGEEYEYKGVTPPPRPGLQFTPGIPPLYNLM